MHKAHTHLLRCLLRGGKSNRRLGARRNTQHGVAALEFALILPVVLILFLGVITFSSALFAKQGLYDMAGETARACVLKSFDDYDAINNCVVGVGSFLTNNVQKNICLDSAVTFTAAFPQDTVTRTNVPSSFPQVLEVLQVTASCTWNFAPGFAALGIDAPTSLSATASMPLLYTP